MNFPALKNPLKKFKNHFLPSVIPGRKTHFLKRSVMGFYSSFQMEKVWGERKWREWGGDFHKDFCEVKDQLKRDTSMYGFFDKCVLVNEFLTRKNLFLKFYEKRDKYRYLIKKGACSRVNKVTHDLSSSVIEKFNGYEIIKRGLRNKEKEDFCPIDVLFVSLFLIEVTSSFAILQMKFT